MRKQSHSTQQEFRFLVRIYNIIDLKKFWCIVLRDTFPTWSGQNEISPLVTLDRISGDEQADDRQTDTVLDVDEDWLECTQLEAASSCPAMMTRSSDGRGI